MPSRVILFSGASAVGKTAAVKALFPLLNIAQCCVCKIDCLRTQDDEAYRRMGVPCVAGLSRDICPDHFLVSTCRNSGSGRTRKTARRSFWKPRGSATAAPPPQGR